MVTLNESLDKFKEKTNALINAKYLFAEREIGEVLKVIADSRMLYELFEYVTEDFNYETFKSVCFSKGKAVKLPKRDEDLLALCLMLLIDIDRGNISLDEFCDEYFPNGGSSRGKYAGFVLSVIIPFADTTEKMVYKLINAQKEEQSQSEADDVNRENFKSDDMTEEGKIGKNFPNKKNPADNSRKDAAPDKNPVGEEKNLPPKESTGFVFLDEEKKKLDGKHLFGKPETAEEGKFIFDSLAAALRKRNYESVAACFIALKYFARAERKYRIDADKISAGIAGVMNKND